MIKCRDFQPMVKSFQRGLFLYCRISFNHSTLLINNNFYSYLVGGHLRLLNLASLCHQDGSSQVSPRLLSNPLRQALRYGTVFLLCNTLKNQQILQLIEVETQRKNRTKLPVSICMNPMGCLIDVLKFLNSGWQKILLSNQQQRFVNLCKLVYGDDL